MAINGEWIDWEAAWGRFLNWWKVLYLDLCWGAYIYQNPSSCTIKMSTLNHLILSQEHLTWVLPYKKNFSAEYSNVNYTLLTTPSINKKIKLHQKHIPKYDLYYLWRRITIVSHTMVGRCVFEEGNVKFYNFLTKLMKNYVTNLDWQITTRPSVHVHHNFKYCISMGQPIYWTHSSLFPDCCSHCLGGLVSKFCRTELSLYCCINGCFILVYLGRRPRGNF